MRGTVKAYYIQDKLGVICGEDMQNYYFHFSEVGHFKMPPLESHVSFDPISNGKELSAKNITISFDSFPFSVVTIHDYLNNFNYIFLNCTSFTNSLYFSIQDFQKDPVYLLYTYVSQNAKMNIDFLVSQDLRYEFTGFLPFKRNLRFSFEAFVDMYNFAADCDYIHVLGYNHKNQDGTYKEINLHTKYSQFLKKEYGEGYSFKKHFLSLGEKYNIATKMYHLSPMGFNPGEDLYSFVKTIANEGAHPDIFITPITDLPTKEILLRLLLITDITLLKESFILLLRRYEQAIPANAIIADINNKFSELTQRAGSICLPRG